VFLVAFFVTKKERKEKNSSNYFLGGQSASWFVIGASLFASNIGSEHLIGLSGSGARGDFVNGQFELLAALILLLLGWFFVPYYMRSGVYTMPEFLEKRFSKSARNYLSVVSVIAYILTKISVTIFAGALVFDQLLGVDFWVGAGLVVIFTGVYTIFGGLKAVVYTDMVQMFVLTAGSIALIYFGLDALGGWDMVTEAIETHGGESKDNYLNLWRSNEDSSYPWTGIMFGAPILGVWYWCTDQFIVQRVLAAKDQSHARKGTIFAGFLKILPIFLFVLPGVIAFALHQQDGKLLLDSNGVLTPDSALPAMVVTYLPSGIKGLVAAGLLAALMSSLSSVFNSCSTLVTFDYFKVRNPEANEKTLVRFGQWATVALVIVGLLWIPIMASQVQSDGLFKYLQSVQAYISPPIAAAFIFGLLWKRLNAKGAMWALWSGFIIGMIRFALEILSDGGDQATLHIAKGTLLGWFTHMNFLHFALFLFIICSLVLIGVSYATKEDNNTDFDFGFKSAIAGKNRGPIVLDAALSGLLIIAVIVMWMIFSPIGIA
ncbi:MAG: sodium:solute symporter, partial [Bacteroidota bacterium]